MLEVIKMNKKNHFEAFKIPEDGVVDLVELSSWLGDNGINMSSIKPGDYIVKDMNVRSSRVTIIDEETLYRSYDIKEDIEKIMDITVTSKMKSNLDLKGDILHYTGAPCSNCGRGRVEIYANGEQRCDDCYWNLTKGEYEPFELIDTHNVKKSSQPEVENNDGPNV